MLLEPGKLHRTLSVPPEAVFKVAIIPADEVRQAASELGSNGEVHLARASSDDPQLCQVVWQLGLIAEREHASRLEVQSQQAAVLRALLGHAERRAERQQPQRASMAERARDYLHDHVADDVSLDELATASAGGRFQLLRAAKRWGVAPHAYHIQLRVHRARVMLRQGYPAGRIAADLGFSDRSHFIRHFRRITGVTPGAYSRT